jgi:hypothetical protein
MLGGNCCAGGPRIWGPDHHSRRRVGSLIIVKFSDDRRGRGQFQSGMVNMGGGELDDLKEVGCELKIVSCSVEKLIIPGYLIWGVREHSETQECR